MRTLANEKTLRSHRTSLGPVFVFSTTLIGTYLDVVGQLRGHQLVELLRAQGGGGGVVPGEPLELGDQGADGGLHGDCEETGDEVGKRLAWKREEMPPRSHLLCDAAVVSLHPERTVPI